MMRERGQSQDHEARLLVRAEPPGQAVSLCRRIVGGAWMVDGLVLLEADPAWAGAINTVLVKKGIRVSELRLAG